MPSEIKISGKDAAASVRDAGPARGGWRQGLRSGDWLNWERIRFTCVCSAILYILGLLWMLAIPNKFGSPNGVVMMDYLSFWLAGKQVFAGAPEVAYLPNEFAAVQKEFSGSDVQFGFFYPPTFQLMQSVFAVLPYRAAFAAFIAVTTGLLLLVCRMITGRWLLAACLVLIPACGNNAFHGQNAALTAALYGFFLLGIERRQLVLAGIAAGILTIKPQLGILIPVALLASLNWRTFLSASVTTLVYAGVSAAVMGVGVWVVFWQQAPVATAVLEMGGVEWGKMISVYGAARVIGLGHPAAMVLQGIAGLCALVCVWVAWRRSQEMSVRAPVLVGGALLVTPFALSYDLTLIVAPCAFLIRDGLKKGFPAYEKLALFLVIALSMSTSPFAIWLGLPIAPLLPALLVWIGLRHMRSEAEAGPKTGAQSGASPAALSA